MGEFWKNEWNLFKSDISNFKEFWAQPVTFGAGSDLMLKPTAEEVEQKAQDLNQADSFWAKEWGMFKNEMGSVKEFLTQPIVFK